MGLFARFSLTIALAILALATTACSSRSLTPNVPSGALSAAHAATQTPGRKRPRATDNWVAGSGNWSEAANWSGGTPKPSDDAGITNAGGNVTLDVPATVNALTLGAGDKLSQNLNQTMSIGGTTIVNSGTWTIDSAQLTFNTVPVTLSGGGSITLNGATCRIAFGTSLDNADNLITGQGAYGDGTIGLANGGTVEARGGTLTVQSNGSGTSNTGTLEAASGATLVIYSPTTTQTGAGKIVALPGGTVQLHALVNGGHISSSGTGDVVVLGGNTNTLENVTITGRYDVESAGTSVWMNTITNNGTIGLNSTGGGTPVIVTGVVKLVGTGTVRMSDNPDNSITPGTNGMLIVGNPIEGSGGITSPFQNLSTIDANVKSPLTISTGRTATNVNGGVMEATSGGTLVLIGGTLDNHGGEIDAAPGSQVWIQGTIGGGLLRTSGSGTFQGQGGTIDGTAHPIVSRGAIVIPNFEALNAGGTIENDGTITITSTGQSTLLDLIGSLTLTGSGQLVLNKGGVSGQSTQTLTIGSIVEGGGTITGMNVAVRHGGLLEATARTPMAVVPGPRGLVSSGDTVLDGDMNVNGSFTQTKAGQLQADVGVVAAKGHAGLMTVTGNATLAGRLAIVHIGNFVPPIGATFTILKASDVDGKFGSVTGASVGSKAHFQVRYLPTVVELKVVKNT